MSQPESYSFRRYLDAKRTVDSRARDRRVTEQFRSTLDAASHLRICEIGAGTGTTAAAVREWTDCPVEYHAVDTDESLLEAAADRIERSDRFEIRFHVADALEYLRGSEQSYDVVIGQAFLDLTDVPAAIETIAGSLEADGIGYFPITFDGVTALLPRIDPALDREIERRFHDHMDTTEKASGATGDSTAGRRLLTAVPASGGELLAAGGSDWVVAPDDGGYEGDEAYFLHHIVHTIESALTGADDLDREQLRAWSTRRHEQIESGTLTYLTHQLDVLAGWPA